VEGREGARERTERGGGNRAKGGKGRKKMEGKGNGSGPDQVREEIDALAKLQLIHTADAHRSRRCEHNSQLAHDDCRQIPAELGKLALLAHVI